MLPIAPNVIPQLASILPRRFPRLRSMSARADLPRRSAGIPVTRQGGMFCVLKASCHSLMREKLPPKFIRCEPWVQLALPINCCTGLFRRDEVERFIAGLRAPELIPPKSFLVTFDDAYRSLREDALECLDRLRLPAVVFAPTDFVGGWNRFDHDTEPREEICEWATLRELARHGVSIQSHGVTHRALSTLPLSEQEREAAASRHLLEKQLGSPVRLFAYPYGDPGDEQRLPGVLRRAGYEAAFGYGGGALRLPADNPYMLPRLAMGPDTDVREELALRA